MTINLRQIAERLGPYCNIITRGYRCTCPLCLNKHSLDIRFKGGQLEVRRQKGCGQQEIISELYRLGLIAVPKKETPHRGQPGGDHNGNKDHTSKRSNHNTPSSQDINIVICCSCRCSRSGEADHG